MTLNLKLFAMTMIMAVLAACGTTEPDVSDWCFVFNFRDESDYDFELTDGEYQDRLGFVTSDGLLDISYEHSALISPSAVTIAFTRADIEGGALLTEIDTAASGSVFGVNANFVQTLPAGVPGGQLTFTPANVGDGGRNVSIRLEVTQAIAISSIRVVGDGAASYPLAWDCNQRPQGPTPTMTAPTPTPSNTPTGTQTPTPTNTPGPTSTPFVECQNVWNPVQGSGSPSSPPPFAEGIGSYQLAVNGIYWASDRRFIADWGGPGSIRVRLNGTSFPNVQNLTLAASYIPGAQGSQGISINIRFLNNGVPLSDNVYGVRLPTINQAASFQSPSAWDEILISWNQPHVNQAFFFRGITVRVCEFQEDALPTPTAMPTLTHTSTSTSTPLPTRTPIPTATPRPPTRTPIPTLTPRPASTSTPRPSSTPIQIVSTPTPGNPTGQPPTPTPVVITATPGGQPMTPTVAMPSATPGAPTLTPGASTATPGGITSTPGGPTATPGGPPGDGGGFDPNAGNNGIAAPLDEWIDIANYAGQIVAGSFTLFGTYGGEAFTLGLGLLNQFINAPPIPIPGLPDCVRAPLAHELCAVWYIMDWTFFAPGTPGALIVPLLNIIMIISIVIVVIRMVFRIINRGESATGVS